MARKFQELRDKMSPERRARNEARTRETLEAMDRAKKERPPGAGAVEDILRELDPQLFIKMGAPPNEYDIEADDIAPLLEPSDDVEQILDKVHAVFVKWFSSDPDDYDGAGDRELYRAVAERIAKLDLWR